MYVIHLILLLSIQGCFVFQPYGETRKLSGQKALTPATKELLKLVPSDKNFLKNLRRLAEDGADFSAKNAVGHTVLHEIVMQSGSDEAAEFVAAQLDNVDVLDDEDNTPLAYAVSNNNLPLARVLTKHGADTNVYMGYMFNGKNNSALLLHKAIRDKHVEMAMLLVEHKADPNKKDTEYSHYGRTALHIVEDVELAKFLFEHGGDLNARDTEGETPLCLKNSASSELVKLFIDHNADVNAEDKFGRSILYAWVLHLRLSSPTKELENIKLLLANGADPNHLNKKGESPLHNALSMGRSVKDIKKISTLLLEAGANPNARTAKGKTPTDLAVQKKLIEVVELFEQYGGWVVRNPKPDKKNMRHADFGGDEIHEGQLSDYLENLTELAEDKDNSPVYGREQEIEQVSNALIRKNMRGILLVGEPGVGKTAIVKALAYMLAKDQLPKLAGREIF